MKSITPLAKTVKQLLRRNSPAILTGIGVTGVVSTAYLAAKASFEAARKIDKCEATCGISDNSRQRLIENAKHVAPLYIPAGLAGGVTIGCIIMATRVGNRRTAAITAAYSISERAFNEYREKVVEKFGEKKEQAVRDDIAQDRVNRNSSQGIVVQSGSVLCFEQFTGRYFNCDMETLRSAENSINAKMIRENYATLSDFYYLIGLAYTSDSSDVGWTNDRLMNLQFSTVMSEDSRPCLAFDYNYLGAI